MEKPAETVYPVHDLVLRRWSPRAFSDRPVEAQKLRQLLEAARWAASSYNEQPWRFILATQQDEAGFEKALSCLVPGNQAWAKDAPALILAVGKTEFSKNGNPNRCWAHDIGLAIGNLSLQATALGLVVHQMAGIDTQAVRQTYAVPDGYEPFSATAIGYAGDAGSLPEDWMRQAEQAPRTRLGFDEFVFGSSWDQPTGLF